VELASFPCAYLAAENMLTRAAVRAGEKVLVTGASGGVGSAAVQLARRRGATVIALAERSKAAAIEELGASPVLPREADLLAALGPGSIDVIVDVVGGERFTQLLEVLVRTGRYAVAGAIAGALVGLDLRTLYLKDLSLLGCTIPPPDVFANLVGYIERGEIRPLIATTYPLQEIAAAQGAFMSKSHVGKIVLII
jgi:NADPH:quinone reductase-like Zn-dependent oxidoreductase